MKEQEVLLFSLFIHVVHSIITMLKISLRQILHRGLQQLVIWTKNDVGLVHELHQLQAS